MNLFHRYSPALAKGFQIEHGNKARRLARAQHQESSSALIWVELASAAVVGYQLFQIFVGY